MTMAGIMRRYLKMLFSSKRKQEDGEGGRRTTARLPVLNSTGFDEEGCEETVRQSAETRVSTGSGREADAARGERLTDTPFRLLREITFLHSDVEIP